jgi:acetylornithine aminotransferase
MQLSPVLAELAQYPFARLDDWKAAASSRGIELIDFGMGDPREPTPSFIREAMLASVDEVSSYPRATGLPELRTAIAGWIERRFGASVDPATEIVPTLGSKEAIFSFPQVALAGKQLVAIPEPAYPVYERGTLFAGGSVATVPLSERNGWLPDLDAFDAWDEIALFWTCYPNNPTGATAPLGFYEELAELARAHGFLLCSDEAYSELWFDEPPVSALEAADRSRIVVFNTLSKRSSMTGYRSGFVAGPAELVATLKGFRPTVGTAPQEFVQRASIVAWSDEEHVRRTRALYRRKRDLIRPALEAKGLRVAASEASFFLWIAVPDGDSSEGFAARLLEHGIVVAPGSFFGPAGEGYVRLALVPTEEECARAARIIEEVL